jgi:hypothetical protein
MGEGEVERKEGGEREGRGREEERKDKEPYYFVEGFYLK